MRSPREQLRAALHLVEHDEPPERRQRQAGVLQPPEVGVALEVEVRDPPRFPPAADLPGKRALPDLPRPKDGHDRAGPQESGDGLDMARPPDHAPIVH